MLKTTKEKVRTIKFYSKNGKEKLHGIGVKLHTGLITAKCWVKSYTPGTAGLIQTKFSTQDYFDFSLCYGEKWAKSVYYHTTAHIIQFLIPSYSFTFQYTYQAPINLSVLLSPLPSIRGYF